MRLLVGGLLFLLALPPLLRAQDSVIVIDPDLPPGDSSVVRAGPPPDVVAELLAFYNDCATTRMQGDVSFPAGSVFAGRLAIFRGSLRLAGRVRGDVVVINATLYLLPGADVEGDVLVVGGRLIRSPGARHVGPGAGVVGRGTGAPRRRTARSCCASAAARWASWPRRAPASRPAASGPTLLLATGGTYNRIEGLPIVFGPTFELRPSRRSLARLDLRGILRTAGEGSRLSSDFGYGARAELRFPGGGIAGRIYSEVAPFEDQPLSPPENGWSAFLLQRDYRDYFERRGGGGAAWVQPDPRRSASSSRSGGTASSSRPGHRSVVAAPQQRSLAPQSAERRRPLLHHRRSSSTSTPGTTGSTPSTGWLLRARYEHCTSDDVAPVALPGDACARRSRPAAATPSTGSRSTFGATRG